MSEGHLAHRAFLRLAAGFLAMAACFFGSAGTLLWPATWASLFLHFSFSGALGDWLYQYNPELLEQRLQLTKRTALPADKAHHGRGDGADRTIPHPAGARRSALQLDPCGEAAPDGVLRRLCCRARGPCLRDAREHQPLAVHGYPAGPTGDYLRSLQVHASSALRGHVRLFRMRYACPRFILGPAAGCSARRAACCQDGARRPDAAARSASLPGVCGARSLPSPFGPLVREHLREHRMDRSLLVIQLNSNNQRSYIKYDRVGAGIQHVDRSRRMITISLKKRVSQFSLKQLSLRLGLSLFQGG